MALKVTQEPLENRQLSMTIEVDQERVDKELKKAARKLARQYRIPGFRKGKAPYSVIVQQIGLPMLYNEFSDSLGQEVYREAIEQEGIEPYAIASLEEIDVEPMRYTLTVPLEPEIDLGDYRGLRVEEEEPEVTEEEIAERLAQYTEQYAGWKELERPSQYGDLMTVDVRSVIPAEGDDEETVVLDETEWEITPDEENPMDPPGFDEQLLGLTPGDEKEFTLSWPEDSQSIYAGKSANFSVTVHGMQAYENAELTDELAQMIGPDFDTVDDLRKSVRETILEEKQARAENEYFEKAMQAALEESTLIYPPVVIEDQLDSMMNDFEQQLHRAGIENLRSYFEATGQDLDAFRESQRESATIAAEQNLILSELISAEKLKVTREDVEDEIALMMGDSSEDESDEMKNLAEMFRSGAGRQIIESNVLRRKAVDRLLAIVRGEEIPEPEEEDESADDEAADEATEDAAEASTEAQEADGAENQQL
jgi:trigger factor